MAEIVDITVPLAAIEEPLSCLAARALAWPAAAVGEVRVLRRALDARRGRPIAFHLRIEVRRAGEPPPPAPPPRLRLHWPAARPPPRVVVVGSGPAGTWAALRLAEAGVPVTVVERGKPVQPRRRDLARLHRGTLDPSSNYCFGEGGAGTYSDGKLHTRTKQRLGVSEVIADLVRFGAPPEIAVESRPHVGSNRLPGVLTALREHLQRAGVSYRFETDVVGIRTERGRLRSVRLDGGDELPADAAVLAAGHSARSVYAWAFAAGLALERKPMAVGVRIEHPQPLIDELQYGPAAGDARLPAAFYELHSTGAGRAVYSFCMCPGGRIVPAATEIDGVVVNGMSLAGRDSPFANAAFVVTVDGADYGPAAAGPLAGVAFQRAMEQAAFRAGGGAFRAPAQRLGDYLAGRKSVSVGPSSYRPGVVPGDLGAVLPLFIAEALRDGLRGVGRILPGFLHPDALLVGVETRTSAPVRLLRDPATLQSPSVAGLFPAGEGAGYAGGIVSAALDGARIAERILAA